MEQNMAQHLKEAGQRIKKFARHGQTQGDSSKGGGKEVFMLACLATNREKAKAFLDQVIELEAGLESKGCTTILLTCFHEAGFLENACSDRSPKDDFVDMSQCSSEVWEVAARGACRVQSVSADSSAGQERPELDEKSVKYSVFEPKTRILPFPLTGWTTRKARSSQIYTRPSGPEPA